MRKIVRFLSLLSLFFFGACSLGQASGIPVATLEPVPAEFAGSKNPLGPEAAAVGAEVYSASCQSCHGPQGYGDGPAAGYLDPHPKNLAELQTQAGDDYLFWRISSGRVGTAMISWQGILTEEQIWQLVAFIRTLK